MRISAWGSDVCSSDLIAGGALVFAGRWALDHWDGLDGTGRDLASALLVGVLIAGSWLLFRAVAIAVVGLFADAIVADVEARHYPAAAARAVNVGWRASIDPLDLAKALIAAPNVTPATGAVFDVLEAALTPLGFTVERFIDRKSTRLNSSH